MMKAICIRNIGELEIIEREVPKVSPGHVLLKVSSISICGTDIHQLEGKAPAQLPRIPGHDFSGIIVELGKDVEGFTPGDRVVVKPSFPCYICSACKAGFYAGCTDTRLIGRHSDGCFREYMNVPAANLIRMSERVSMEAASILEPFTVGLNVFSKLKMDLGQTVTVLGQGPIGLGVTRIAALSGAARIYAVDIRDNVLEVSRQFGATETINSMGDNAIGRILDKTGGGTDIVIETAGASATVGMIPALVKKGGMVVNVGIFQGIGAIPVEAIVSKGLHVIGVGGNGGKGKYEGALELVERGLIDPTLMVTDRFPFDEAIQAFERARNKAAGSIKVVVYA